MPRRRRLAHVRFGRHPEGRAFFEPDPDERYILVMAGTWMSRIISRYPLLDGDTLDIIVWFLGDQSMALGDILVRHEGDDDADDLREELAECEIDPGQTSSVVGRRLCKKSRPERDAMCADVLELIESRIKSLRSSSRSPMKRSVEKFQQTFGLTDLEQELFTLLFLMGAWGPMEHYFDQHLCCTSPEGYKYLAAALDTTRAQITSIVRGTLFRSGLIERGYREGFSISDEFSELLADPLQGMFPTGLYRDVPKEPLRLDEHDLEPDVVSRAVSLMTSSTNSPIQIVLHGPAGAGKTTFARRLAQESGRPVVEVPPNEQDKTGARRLGIVAALRLKSRGEGVTILVDEADSLLETATAWSRRGDSQDKAWLNELLETPGSRVIWITNSTTGIEPSALRRFAFSIKFEAFDRKRRIRLWNRILRRRRIKRFFDQSAIESLARRYELSAGVIDMAVATAAATEARKRAALHDAVTQALDAHVILTTGTKPRKDREAVDPDYSLEGLNIDSDIDLLFERLETFDKYLRDHDSSGRHSMNLLFHGPPGTGKSELARYIAERLDRELIVERASDLLNPYVGMTEQRIAAAFARAERQDAVLVIDEIDTMLFDRARAVRSWEVSFTNELLTQMERFRGLLIATTNRLVALDDASIRRFAEKIRVDFLTPPGNVIFYEKMLASIVGKKLDDRSKRRLEALSMLAPGDFKIVRDRWVFSRVRPGHADLVSDLEAEARLKRERHSERRVGF